MDDRRINDFYYDPASYEAEFKERDRPVEDFTPDYRDLNFNAPDFVQELGGIEDLAVSKDEPQKIKNWSMVKRIAGLFIQSYMPIYVNGRLWIYHDDLGSYAETSGAQVEHLLSKISGSDLNYCSRDIAETISYVKRVSYRDPDQIIFNPDERYINCRDGVFDTENFDILKHSPIFAFNYTMDVKLGKPVKDKKFLKFLEQICCGSPSKIELLQEVIGYVLSNHFKAKAAFLLLGVPNSGKSTLLNVVSKMIGPQNVSSVPFSALNNRFELSAMYGKRLNACGEMNTAIVTDVARFKQITGYDSISVEFKGQTAFSTRLLTKLLYAGNNVPQVKNEAYVEAVFDRLVIVFFGRSVPREDCDRNLDDKLHKERTGIFMWAMEGLKRLRRNNWVFTVDPESQAIKERELGQGRSILCFEEGFVRYEDNAFTPTEELLEAYTQFCDANGFPRQNVKALHEYFSMPGKGISDRKTIGGTKYRGFFRLKLVKPDLFLEVG